MNMFTPALLLCLPLWATASFLQAMQKAHMEHMQQMENMQQMEQAKLRAMQTASRDGDCPTQWAGMPFVPPSVHAL